MGLDTGDELSEEYGESLDDLLKIPLSKGDPNQIVRIYLDLNKVTKEGLTIFL